MEEITVHVICWDHREYDRKATIDEINENDKKGYVTRENDKIIFDFRIYKP